MSYVFQVAKYACSTLVRERRLHIDATTGEHSEPRVSHQKLTCQGYVRLANDSAGCGSFHRCVKHAFIAQPLRVNGYTPIDLWAQRSMSSTNRVDSYFLSVDREGFEKRENAGTSTHETLPILIPEPAIRHQYLLARTYDLNKNLLEAWSLIFY
ncbi:hypothetical protein BDR06DRAFT_947977 [Suillus hirtellus]|nr:hypothetical protein BDR06DRAFT_947977 [Suillus hirtellus]